jgi:hypothetical protein
MPPTTSHDPLAELEDRLRVIRDRVRGVALGHHNGFYLFGRAGTSKTYTVKTTLEEIGKQYAYHSGHLTDIGLFELLEENHDRVIVLDDVSAIFKQKIGLQLMLAALGNQPSDRGTRIVKYKRKGADWTIRFTGGIIAVSNLELHTEPVLAALKSRVHYLKYDPSDEQMEAMILDVASKGWTAGQLTMTPFECREVAKFLVAESRHLSIRLDMRNLVDKAYPDYLQHRSNQTDTHWKDLVRSSLEEQLIALQHSPEKDTREGTKMKEQILVRTLMTDCQEREDRIQRWHKLTGKSERAFYRRLQELDLK